MRRTRKRRGGLTSNLKKKLTKATVKKVVNNKSKTYSVPSKKSTLKTKSKSILSKATTTFQKDWDPQVTNEDCLPFHVFLGAVLSRACYDPPSVFALDIADTYDSVFLQEWLSSSKRLLQPSSECRMAGKQKAFSSYVKTGEAAKKINTSFVGNEARVLATEQSTKPKTTNKLSQLPPKFYTYQYLDESNKSRLQEQDNWAYIYIHTSEDLSVYLLADKLTYSVYVIFRGTRSLQNVKSDLKPHAQILCDDSADKKDVEEVFKGVYKLQNEAIHSIYYSTIWLADNFLKATKKNPVQLWSYGHSLGGASASLFAYLWVGIHDEQIRVGNQKADICMPNIHCSTYGAPKVFNQILNKHFERLMKQGRIQYVRYVTEGDVITSLPPEAKIKKGVLNFTLVHPGKNLGSTVLVKGKERQSNYSLLKCINPLSQLKGTSHLIGTMIKRDRSKLKPISMNYEKPLRCTSINYNPKLDINPNAHGIQARIEYMFVLSNFTTGSELETGSSVKQKMVGKSENSLMKVFYSIPKKLDMHGHLFDIKNLSEPNSNNDNKVISYEKFVSMIGQPLLNSKNNTNTILQNKLNGAYVVKASSKSTVEHLDNNTPVSKTNKVDANVKAGKTFNELTCRQTIN